MHRLIHQKNKVIHNLLMDFCAKTHQNPAFLIRIPQNAMELSTIVDNSVFGLLTTFVEFFPGLAGYNL